MKKSNSLPSLLTELNCSIENYLLDNKIRTRKGASPGLWLCFVLPSSIIFGIWNTPDCGYFYRSATCLSVGLLLNSLSIIFQVHHSTEFRTICCVINSITTTLLLHYFTEHSLAFSVMLGIFSSFGFNKLLLLALQAFPETFTFGEAAVVVEAITLFLASVVAMLFTFTPVTCIDISTKILQVGITGLMVLCGCVYYFPRLRNPLEFYCSLAAVLVVIVVLLHILLGFSSILWIFYLATEDMLTLKLIGSWVLASVVAVVAAMTQVKVGHKASTVVRKYFHLLALAVYLPGLILNPCLLYLASGIIFAVFVGLEMVRVAKVAPVAEALDLVFLTFVDDKDAGAVALTPLCLMAGVSAPLWLHPAPNSAPASLPPLLAGLLSVGVGDTAASVCGSLFGQHKWPDSQRTKEGSAACFISQLFFIIALIHFGYIPRNNLLQPIVAISAVSWVEATTDQIDNLALPFLMYILLS